MANRLTRIYTRTGDKGTTGLANGTRQDKDSLRITAIGEIDELNSLLGVVGAHTDDASICSLILELQHKLFDMGGELALPETELIGEEQITALEQQIDKINQNLPPLREFILPGGNVSAAFCHQARTVCRRAERGLLHLSRSEPVNATSLRFLNRLSDLLFVLARHLALENGGREIHWQKMNEE